jgi:hypothetical protein
MTRSKTLIIAGLAALACGSAAFAQQAAPSKPDAGVADVCLTNSCSTPGAPLPTQPPQAAPVRPELTGITGALQAGYAAGKPWLETMKEQGFEETERTVGPDGNTTYRFSNADGGQMVLRMSPGVTPGAPPPPGAVMIQRAAPGPARAP